MLEDVLQVASDGRADVVDVDQERVVPCSACVRKPHTDKPNRVGLGGSASGWEERVGLGGACRTGRSELLP